MQGTGCTVVPNVAGVGAVVSGGAGGVPVPVETPVPVDVPVAPEVAPPVAPDADPPVVPGTPWVVLCPVGVPAVVVSPVPAASVLPDAAVPDDPSAPQAETGGTAGGTAEGGDVSAPAVAGSAMARAPIAVTSAVHLDGAVIHLSFCRPRARPTLKTSCQWNERAHAVPVGTDWQSQAQRPAVYDGLCPNAPARLFR